MPPTVVLRNKAAASSFRGWIRPRSATAARSCAKSISQRSAAALAGPPLPPADAASEAPQASQKRDPSSAAAPHFGQTMRCRLLQNKVTGRTLLARSTQEIFSEVSSARWAQERKRRSAAKAEV